jgi:hypothetical protein
MTPSRVSMNCPWAGPTSRTATDIGSKGEDAALFGCAGVILSSAVLVSVCGRQNYNKNRAALRIGFGPRLPPSVISAGNSLQSLLTV